MTPADAMRLALAEARRGLGLTRPNPAVGAVVVKGGRVVGRGFHPKAGEPHAEIFALREAGARAKGADLHVTLEPCSTRGRTGPCTEAILKSGIRRVFVGSVDPNPRHAGRGLDLLREAGIRIESGILREECDDLLRAFAHWITRGLPFVTVKLGMTLDGRIADKDGASKWITGEAARDKVQELRRQADAIWVGRGTLRADDPGLLPRPDEGRRPYRLVLDPLGRLPMNLRVFTEHPEQTMVFASPRCAARRIQDWQRAGVEVLEIPSGPADAQVGQALATAARRGLLHVLCEGGGGLAGQLVRLGLAQELALFYNPSVLGTDARPAFDLAGLALDQRPRFRLVEAGTLGLDFFVRLAAGADPEAPKPPETKSARKRAPAAAPTARPRVQLSQFFDY